jgi:P4 family phage/plasmid primase-like protien
MPTAADYEKYTPDPWGFARFIADAHSSRLRYALDTDRFYKYTGARWEEVSPSNTEIGTLINRMALYIGENLPPKPDKDEPGYYAHSVQVAFVKLAGTAGGTASIISKLKEDDRIWCHFNDFASQPYLINFSDCTVNVHEPWVGGEDDEEDYYMHAHNPADMLATVLKYPYPAYTRPETPLWDNLLMHMCDYDVSLKESLQDALAYGLLGENPEQMMVFLVGEAGIGKTQALEIMTELAGSLGGHAKIDLIQSNYGQEHDSLRSELRGKHIVLLGETSHRLKLDETKFKDLTGSTYMPTRKLGQQPVATKVTWTLYCATNEMPEVRGEMDESVSRRMWIFELPGKTIPAGDRDPALTRKIVEQEGPAILYKLVKRLSEWYGTGNHPVLHIKSVMALDAYREESNTVSEFAKECLHLQDRSFVTYAALQEAYVNFCQKRRLSTVSKRQLIKGVSEAMQQERDSKHCLIRGIAMTYEAPAWQS